MQTPVLHSNSDGRAAQILHNVYCRNEMSGNAMLIVDWPSNNSSKWIVVAQFSQWHSSTIGASIWNISNLTLREFFTKRTDEIVARIYVKAGQGNLPSLHGSNFKPSTEPSANTSCFG